MPRLPETVVRPARVMLLLSAPAGAVFATLAVMGVLSAAAALLAWIATAIGLAALLSPMVRGMLALPGYLTGLIGEAAAAPPPHFGAGALGRDLAVAVRRLDRAWRERLKSARNAAAANESVVNALPDPLILLRRDRLIARANHAAAALLGDDLGGRNLAACLRAPELLAAVDAVRDGARDREVELGLPGAEGQQFLARVQTLPTVQDDGSAILLSLHDVTAIKRTDRMRADFVANASHEIRTPLAALVGAIETLAGPARDDPAARDRFLAIMSEHAQRINSLVGDLLSLSRIEMIEHSAPSEAIEIGPVLHAAWQALEWKAKPRNVRCEIDLPEGLPTVIGDSGELGQLFQNLLDNAIKYGDRDGVVRVAAKTIDADRADPAWPDRRPAVAVSVRDRGPGIAREHLGRLTERFYRIDKARSREMGGTGLGLAIVKHIVNRHRGRLVIDSAPGEGSTFTVLLPAADESAADQAPLQ